MTAMPSPVQADFPSSLPVKPASSEGDGLERRQLPGVHREAAGRGRFGLVSLLITFSVGVALTAAWYSFGGPAREAIAGMSPELTWLAPQPSAVQPALDPATPAAPTLDQQPNAAAVDLDAVRQNVDRIANSQDQIKRSIDQLSAGQEQLTKEIAKLQAVEQYILYKNSEPPATRSPAPPAPAAAPARRPAMPITPSQTPGAAPR